ncbi:hypothetical protein SBA5_1070022 [Candidatus Sulfotelmatomonas gaucii]|uniref:Uncharacterized protein n=1 Tax=Candidatus Sulfuritelmatomonas gaucii TaxID=2043161 RepID=A0A2N9L314_9BACT|nr:hypothetical protein SBA5_1070022 [Candidatus Sulfotelmatomonas gaucii]
MTLHVLGAPFAHQSRSDIANLAITRPELADAGSVYAQLPLHKRNGFRKVVLSSRYESSQATNG